MNATSENTAGQRWRMYAACCMSLATGAMIFIIRADIQETLRDKLHVSHAEIGGIMGLWALGIAGTIFLSSWLCDSVGMGNLLRAAAALQIIAVPLTIIADSPVMLQAAVLLTGLAHGFIEGSINPLIATIYPDEKTHKLNVLHAWWPGGLVIGGLLAVGLNELEISYQIKYGIIVIPALVYGALTLGVKFPNTERVAAGVSSSEMTNTALQPAFILMFACMFATAATELGPNQWMESVLKETAKMSGTAVLAYISGIMFVMRFFAGALAHKINPIGILCLSSVFSALGLLGLSGATTPLIAYAAATVFAVGVCYYWPTMLGVVSEQFPRGGAFTMCLMGFAGMISIVFVLPLIGKIRDATDASTAFRYVAIIPMVLVVIFGFLYASYQKRGGYKPVSLGVVIAEDTASAAT